MGTGTDRIGFLAGVPAARSHGPRREGRTGLADVQRPVPQATPETQHFWDGTREHELRLQRCDDCTHAYFPPRPFCPACGSRGVSIFAATGKATLYSYIINHRAMPNSGFEAPYAVAVVELEEGPRMMTNIVDSPQTPEALVLDMPLEVTFETLTDEITLPLFRPAQA